MCRGVPKRQLGAVRPPWLRTQESGGAEVSRSIVTEVSGSTAVRRAGTPWRHVEFPATSHPVAENPARPFSVDAFLDVFSRHPPPRRDDGEKP